MMPPSKVLLVTKESTTIDAVNSALSSSEYMTLASVCRELSELGVYLEHSLAAVAVVDIDSDPFRVLEDLGVVVATYPETRFVVLSSTFTNQLVLEAMQVGARNFLLKESVASELVEVLQRLTADIKKREVTLGSIISIFSASGGCGATTVALNLTNELRLTSGKPVLAIDLDCYYGTAATYLGIAGKFSIADVLSRNEPIDTHLVSSIACNYMDDFHVLISPASVEHPGPRSLKYQNLSQMLQVCRQAYRYTIIDAPRVSESVAKDIAALSKVILIVFQLTVKDIRVAQSMVSFLNKSGVASAKIIPLINRFRKRGPFVSVEDGEKALGLGAIPRIRSDFRSAVNSLNRGQPLAQSAPWSGLRLDFRKLADQICVYENNGKLPG